MNKLVVFRLNFINKLVLYNAKESLKEEKKEEVSYIFLALYVHQLSVCCSSSRVPVTTDSEESVL